MISKLVEEKAIISVFCPRCVFSEEFVGHSADVKCLALGHKSGRVMVTGGDDKKVNMWAVGKPNCIMVSPSKNVFELFFVQLPFAQECSVASESLLCKGKSRKRVSDSWEDLFIGGGWISCDH